MMQTVRRNNGTVYQTTRCPIRIDGQRLYSEKGSPDLGEDTDRITAELVNEMGPRRGPNVISRG
jgi:crotonobetainyl-CoA:carnitine CoA-transferase CaiB-like acyl-CoA transferase